MKNSHGFALVQVIVLVTLLAAGAAILSPFLNALSTREQLAESRYENSALKKISDHIYVYALINGGRLPCPTPPPNAAQGLEDRSESGVCNRRWGTVPHRSIEISTELTRDRLGNYITYAIGNEDGALCAGGELAAFDLTAKGLDGEPSTAFALIWHGLSGSGAVTESGAITKFLDDTEGQLSNCAVGAENCTRSDAQEVFLASDSGSLEDTVRLYDVEAARAVCDQLDSEGESPTCTGSDEVTCGDTITSTGNTPAHAIVSDPNDFTFNFEGEGTLLAVDGEQTDGTIFLAKDGSLIDGVGCAFGGRGPDAYFAPTRPRRNCAVGGSGDDVLMGISGQQEVFYHGGTGDDTFILFDERVLRTSAYSFNTKVDTSPQIFSQILTADSYAISPGAPPTSCPLQAGSRETDETPGPNNGRNTLPYLKDGLFPDCTPASSFSLQANPSGIDGGEGYDTLVLREGGDWNFSGSDGRRRIPLAKMRSIERLYLGCPTSEKVEFDSEFLDFHFPSGGTFRVELTGFDTLTINGTEYSASRDVMIAVSGGTVTVEVRAPLPPITISDRYGTICD